MTPRCRSERITEALASASIMSRREDTRTGTAPAPVPRTHDTKYAPHQHLPFGSGKFGPRSPELTGVEGHPVDAAALSAARVGGSAIFTGTMAMFSAAGFTEVARTYPTRPVMRLLV